MTPEVSTVSGDQSVEELKRELAEAREQQAATAEILAASSSSPTDPNRVFAEIPANAARLCGAHNAAIFQLAGDHLRLIGSHSQTRSHWASGVTPDAWVSRRTCCQRQENHPRL